MKQTAVEWLVEQMIERKFFVKNTPLSYTTLEHLTNQAKAMEKEQMGKTFKQAQECAIKSDGVYFKYESFEQYYNKTFKSE